MNQLAFIFATRFPFHGESRTVTAKMRAFFMEK